MDDELAKYCRLHVSLNNHVLIKIFSYLDIDTLTILSIMSERFHALILNYIIPSQLINLNGSCEYNLRLLQLFGKKMCKIKKISMGMDDFIEWTNTYCEPNQFTYFRLCRQSFYDVRANCSGVICAHIESMFTNLNHVSFIHTDHLEMVDFITKGAVNLKSLEIGAVHGDVFDSIVLQMKTRCMQLEKISCHFWGVLAVSNMFKQFLAARSSTLRSVNIGMNNSGHLYETLVSDCPHLEEFIDDANNLYIIDNKTQHRYAHTHTHTYAHKTHFFFDSVIFFCVCRYGVLGNLKNLKSATFLISIRRVKEFFRQMIEFASKHKTSNLKFLELKIVHSRFADGYFRSENNPVLNYTFLNRLKNLTSLTIQIKDMKEDTINALDRILRNFKSVHHITFTGMTRSTCKHSKILKMNCNIETLDIHKYGTDFEEYKCSLAYVIFFEKAIRYHLVSHKCSSKKMFSFVVNRRQHNHISNDLANFCNIIVK